MCLQPCMLQMAGFRAAGLTELYGLVFRAVAGRMDHREQPARAQGALPYRQAMWCHMLALSKQGRQNRAP